MDHYELLGVSRDVSPRELRRAYRRVANEHHPDRNPGDETATRRMAEINDAYDVLSDPVRRFDYDRQLATGSASSGATSQPPSARRSSPASDATPRPPAPDDDPVRRARREAKEREAAEAQARRYRDPGGGYFDHA